MKKNSLQWFGALALMVVSALAFVACSSDSGGGGVPDNSKIVGSWTITNVSPDDDHGPRVGSTMTFNSNGSFFVGGDEGTYTYNSETGAFTAQMNGMTMSGTFVLNGDEATGSVNVTAGGQTKKYEMTMAKKGAEPAVSSTKMVGTWKVVKDSNPDESQVGKTATFNADGTCTWGGKNYTYTCEEQEGGCLNYAIFDGNKQVTNGLLVLVNDGNVLNGNYVYAQSSIKSVICGMVLKKPGYSYPTEGVKGRWTMTFVGQAFGGYDDSFAERLPVSSKEEVFVLDEDGGLYVEGDPHVGSYIDRTNALNFQFAGKYTARITGQITFSGDNIINQSGGLISFGDGSYIGFRGTYQRVESPEEGGDEVSDDRILGSWLITMNKGALSTEGTTITFNADGTWSRGDYVGYFSSEEDEDDGRIKFTLYDAYHQETISGKLVKVSGGNVLNGDYSYSNELKAKPRREPIDINFDGHYGIVMKKANYTYPSGGIKGRWEMTACSLGENAPIGNVLVFENGGELYIEGDPHVGTYTKTNSNIVMNLDNGPTISGTITIDGDYARLTNGTATMEGQQMSITAELCRPGTK